jgi:hypothetical protein
LLPFDINENQNYYIGSRIAGSNRNIRYIDYLRHKVRYNETTTIQKKNSLLE